MNPSFLFAASLAVSALAVTARAQQPARAPSAVRFFVATNGNDRWSGRLANPNQARTDGPLATLMAARDALRKERAAGRLNGGATVAVRGGTYSLAEPIVFSPADSGTAEAPILFQNYRNETAIFSGGTRIGGWKRVGDRWQTTLPAVRDGGWNFVQLWANGQRRSRPRLPKNGYFFVDSALDPSPANAGKGHDRFVYKAGDVRADRANAGDIDYLMFQIWTMARMRAASIDTQNRIVQFTGASGTTEWYGAFPKGHRYLLENVKEALTEPGEWYPDRPSGVLSYLPRAGETPQNTEIIAPRLERLVEFAGDVAASKWVSHITLRGLHFAHSNWTNTPSGNAFSQAEVHLPGAIRAQGARHIVLEDCALAHIGTYGIEFGGGCKDNSIVNCELTDLGAGGIKLGETANPAGEALAERNTVRNCLIAHGGRLHPAAVGVWLGHTPFNTIEHNTIRDFYYTGISPGWSWGYGPSGAHHNTFAYNDISLIGQGVLSDMGGIYTLGLSPGSVLHHNRIYDVQSFDYGGWGIYFDEGTSDIVAENNLVYRTKSAGFHQHYGRNNIVRNNIFAFGGEAQLMRTRPEKHLSFTLERNIVFFNDRPLLGSNWSGDSKNFRLDHNLYWNIGRQPLRFAGKSLAEWQQSGQDQHSLIADPRFVDWKRDDFRLRPDSPALKLGFVPFDVSTAGRLDKNGKARPYRVEVPRAFPPPPGPQPVSEDFENLLPGRKWAFNTSEENETATARVSEEAASPFAPPGRRSLKFTDTPGQKASFNPHVHLDPNFADGIITGRFDVRMEKGAVLYHEWRDGANPYLVGPSLRVEADGSLKAAGRTLMRLQAGQWYRLEIGCTIGDAATGKWRLKVLSLGAAPREWNDLPCDPNFRTLKWVGFVADAQLPEGAAPVVFFIDNVAIHRVAPGGK